MTLNVNFFTLFYINFNNIQSFDTPLSLLINKKGGIQSFGSMQKVLILQIHVTHIKYRHYNHYLSVCSRSKNLLENIHFKLSATKMYLFSVFIIDPFSFLSISQTSR